MNSYYLKDTQPHLGATQSLTAILWVLRMDHLEQISEVLRMFAHFHKKKTPHSFLGNFYLPICL